jgi:hypothetical protein
VVATRGASVDSALSLVRRLPLRWADNDRRVLEADVLSRGWFRGAEECARIIADLTNLTINEGSAFGGPWPMLAVGDGALAPAIPVVADNGPAVGPDGEYRYDQQGVWREAAGSEALFLATDPSLPAPGEAFDLLWFGDSERYLVRGGYLEIEDLFGLVRRPATGEALDRLLIRSRRVDGAILAGVPLAKVDGAITVEVRRPAALYRDDRWRDASRFLAVRADVDEAKLVADRVEARRHDGSTAVFRAGHRDHGWWLTLCEGEYPFNEIYLDRRAGELSLRVTLTPGLEAAGAGMRGRLIFDLRADLVALS